MGPNTRLFNLELLALIVLARAPFAILSDLGSMVSGRSVYLTRPNVWQKRNA